MRKFEARIEGFIKRFMQRFIKRAEPLFASAAVASLLAASAAAGQARSVASAPTLLISSGTAALAARPEPVGNELIREIDDPHSGARWLLYRDRAHPEGPGRLVLTGAGQDSTSHIGADHLWASHLEASQTGLRPQPTIRSGDAVVLEEDSPVASARLQAVALNMAERGSPLRIRLQIGGRVVDAIAEGPGRVSLATSVSLAISGRPGR